MYSLHSRDKSKLTERAMFIVENFEPNANYELDLLIRRSTKIRDGWTLSIRLIFPHMHYKRYVRQASLYGHRVRQARIPLTIRHKQGVMLHSLSRMLQEDQVTFDYFSNNNIMEMNMNDIRHQC